MVLIDANTVFSKIDFQEDIDYNMYPKSIYECPICKSELSFGMQDFKKYSLNKNSSFPIEEQEKIKKMLEFSKRKEPNSFIDYYCPQCNTPTRIYFTAWAGGRYTGGSHLEFIVIDKRVSS
jgi:hypothetical protein